MFPFSYDVLVFVYLGMFRGNDRSVGMRDEVCGNPNVLGVFLWVDEED